MVTQENEHSAYYFTLTTTAHPTPTSSPTPCLLYYPLMKFPLGVLKMVASSLFMRAVRL